MSSTNLKALVSPYLNEVEKLLEGTLTGGDFEAQVNAMCQSIVSAGGKRIRPTVLILTAGLLTNLGENKEDTNTCCHLAATVELLHTATLIHDDVIDNSPKRRGQDTLNTIYGNHVAVLAGDYLFTRCFAILKDLGSMRSIELISKTIATLVTGEINQLERQGDFSLSTQDYLQTIYCKTGALFELSATSFAAYKEADESVQRALATYGREVGNAFQIADDMLDYSSDTSTLGKKVGEDLIDGRVTLPVIIALLSLKGDELKSLNEALEKRDFLKVKEAIYQCRALETCQSEALSCVSQAIDALNIFPSSPFKDGLIEIAHNAVKRIS